VVSFSEPDQLLGIARAAEEAGFHGVLLADHLFFPDELHSRYPYSEDGAPAFDASTPFPDPWTSIAAMAAVTTRLRFATMVYILPLRHPLEVAKTVGSVSLAASRYSLEGVSPSVAGRAGSARSSRHWAWTSERGAVASMRCSRSCPGCGPATESSTTAASSIFPRLR
jgi:hypothetical protein